MPLRFSFESDKFPSLLEIKEMSALVESQFGRFGFEGFSPKTEQVADLNFNDKLPPVEYPGITLANFLISASLPPASFSTQIFEDILQSGRELIMEKKHAGMVGVEMRFVSAACTEKKDGSSIRLEYRDGKALLWISIGHDKSRSIETACQQVSDSINFLKLPLKVTVEDGAYYISTTEDIELVIRSSSAAFKKPHANPGSLSCQIPDTPPNELVERIAAYWSRFARPGSLRPEWSALGGIRSEPDKNQTLYQSLVAANLPAKKIEMILFYNLESLDGLDGLQYIGGPKASFLNQICAFNLPNPEEPEILESAELAITTTAKGHQLCGSISNLDSLEKIQEVLGVKFNWSNQD